MNRVWRRLHSSRVLERVIGYVLIAMVLLSVGLSLYQRNEQGEVVRCQAKVNQEFLEALRHNQSIAKGDRENILQLVIDVQSAGGGEQAQKASEELLKAKTPEEALKPTQDIIKASQSTEGARDALQRFLDRRAELDKGRVQYPPLPGDVCG
jgi:hypothetical protein